MFCFLSNTNRVRTPYAEDILNTGVKPALLLECVRENFEKMGGGVVVRVELVVHSHVHSPTRRDAYKLRYNTCSYAVTRIGGERL